MYHLRLERNQAIGKRRCGAAVFFVFNHLRGNTESFESLDRAAVRKRDDTNIVPAQVHAQHRVHHALLRTTVRPGR